MIEEIDVGFVIGKHGFINARFVEDVIDGGEFLAVDMLVAGSDEITKIVITRNWFGEWRNKMRLDLGNDYDVKWCDFHAAIKRQIELN
ncbi:MULTISPECIES: hypothetical protein [Pectobacterium]|uniref:hypothetical protein n=1 Tax=Pectobacterium TaxID=122277 RepID=UPI00057FB587|nr:MULTISPECIES: hypothetical protein [Pectobacterium]KHT18286.1 hypothetical protein RC97_11750 [Pectobacterium brasiliense]POD96418.1 hypothetical protein BVY06_08740 [Pectobacterium odoriferum]TAJ01886.1 hypothetical protein EG334_21430 [Pectobacterium versatile]